MPGTTNGCHIANSYQNSDHRAINIISIKIGSRHGKVFSKCRLLTVTAQIQSIKL